MVQVLARKSFLFSSLLVYVACFAPVLAAQTHEFKWDVRSEQRSPDCYTKDVVTINGHFPGPNIEAVEGDIIKVEVTNSLEENVTIHWHGIRQRGTVWFDGTNAVTQCPILPKGKFIYEFRVDRAGTFLYHAHYGLLMGTGLYGMIIVKPRGGETTIHANFDHHILLTDWYHESHQKHAADLTAVPFHWVGDPDSILINGRGKFDCKKTPGTEASLCNAENPECSPHSISVKPKETIRLRIGSLTTLSDLSFQIEDHVMTVVEADGSYVEPFDVEHLYIYSGETYSVTIKTKEDSSKNYWLRAKVVSRNSKTPNGLAILNYGAKDPLQEPSTPAGPSWDATSDRIDQSKKYKAHKDHIAKDFPQEKPKREILLLNTQNRINEKVRWCLNNVSLDLPDTPYLISLKENLKDAFDQNDLPDVMPNNVEATTSSGIYRLEFGSVVDVILQNAISKTEGVSESHPWHLHGHDFWVLGYGDGKFDPSTDRSKYNLKNPIMKNTVVLHPKGWTALRFRADNPGVWAFHCHIEYHFFLGMAVIFESGIDHVEKLPESIKGCGKTQGPDKP